MLFRSVQPIARGRLLRALLLAEHAQELGGGLAARDIARRQTAKTVRDEGEQAALRRSIDREYVFLSAPRALDLSSGDVHG